ncbi:MAG: HEAT repeat domain-containing protein [Chloroflexi bacterium]|nr:HEAT repeat domain-containing protein [Chloroflexota bacterium]
MSLTDDIKDFALDLGYSRVGITSAEPFADYIKELNSRRDMYDWYIDGVYQPLKGADPRSLMAAAKSIIMTVYDASKEAFPEKLVGKIGRMYQARCYNAPRHRINGARRQLMRDFLEKCGCHVAERLVVPERLAAARAGVVTYGKNCFAFADGVGSFIIVTSFVVDAELEYDEPSMEVNCPEGCRACLDACPTGALYEPLKMEPRRCVAFNTFMTQDGLRPGITSHIPPEIREKMGAWIHGCDVCQEVCPRNKERLKAKLPPNEYLARVAKDFELTKVLNLSDEYHATRVHPLMYNYIREKKYFQRNAAIALGNMGDPAFVPDLARAMEDPEELVRGYAAWALGRIGGADARRVLEAGLARETADSARREIEAALAVA